MKELTNEKKYKLIFILSVIGFSTSGVFSKLVPWPPIFVAFVRAVVGGIFFYILLSARGERLNFKVIKENLLMLFISSLCISGDWIFYFLACRSMDVSVASLIIYLAPVYMMMASPLIGERLTKVKFVLIMIALFGAIMASGYNGESFAFSTQGLIYAFLASIFYGGSSFFNKVLPKLNNIDRSVPQMVMTAIIVLPVMYITTDFNEVNVTSEAILAMSGLLIGATFIGYGLYFLSMNEVSVQFISMYSYLEPVLIIIWSTLIFSEHLSLQSAIGAVMIIGSALLSELPFAQPKQKKNIEK